jgi:hypothetical protein
MTERGVIAFAVIVHPHFRGPLTTNSPCERFSPVVAALGRGVATPTRLQNRT